MFSQYQWFSPLKSPNRDEPKPVLESKVSRFRAVIPSDESGDGSVADPTNPTHSEHDGGFLFSEPAVVGCPVPLLHEDGDGDSGCLVGSHHDFHIGVVVNANHSASEVGHESFKVIPNDAGKP